MATDLTEYSQLLERARTLFESLKEVRRQIKERETQMIISLNQNHHNAHNPISVMVNQRPGVLRLVARTRRLPLTEKSLTDELSKYLLEKFGGSIEDIATLATDIGHRIWTDRQTKRDFKVALKLA
jgi:hypothetical protein